jgi:choline monooxygenase
VSLIFPFDPDIRRAATVPARLYVDPVYLALEEEKIFGRTWQLVGRADQLRETGDFLTADIARESIVVLRDGETLRGFHNICLHRAGPVAEGCGRRKSLQCRYHGWTYRLDGGLMRAPEMEETEGFDPEEMRLMPVQVATWGPLVFANLDLKAPPLEHFLEDIPERTERFRAETMRYVMRKSWTVECNWKVYVDNYLEGYHVPVVHPGLHRELDYDRYTVEPHRYYSIQHAPLRPLAASASEPSTDSSDPEMVRATGSGDTGGRKYIPKTEDDDAQYLWLFPNIMLNIYQGQMQTNVVLPRGEGRCEVVFDWFANDPPADAATDPEWTKLVGFSDEIQIEDIEICERVQKNLRSRSYDRGRYSAKRENGVHHFHSLLHEFLT